METFDDNLETVTHDHRFPCDVCGADLRYHPDTGGLSCDHCGNAKQILAPRAGWQLAEMDLRAALADQIAESEYEITRVSDCNNCGAQIEFDAKDHATECAYCASPIVVDTGDHRHLKPRGIIPFIISEKDGRAALAKWLGGRWFAPSGLSKFARSGRPLSGIYIPYWTYDAQTRTEYAGKRGDVYHVTRGSGKNRRTVTKVRWSRRSGRVSRFFDDVLILASKAMPKRYTDELAPWDLSGLEPYNTEFLAGYRAEGYTVSLEDGWKEAQQVMRNVITRDVKFDIGGDRQVINDMRTQATELRFKHVLLPIYSLAYKFRGETYRCVINGQTGRVTGERPFSRWKIFFAVLLGAVIVITAVVLSNNAGFI